MKKLILLAGLLLPLFFHGADASAIVNGTRFIFPSNQESIAFRVLNRDGHDYLVNAKILNDEQHVNPVFVTTPPLFQLKAGQENAVRITKVGGELPADRESLFWLSVASIPASDPRAQNALQIAMRSKMKLFYRPTGLKGDPATAFKALIIERHGNELQMTNPTPYYVTLVNMVAGGEHVTDAPMLAPFSHQALRACAGKTPCQLQWQAINDYGSLTPVQQRSLN